MCVHKFVSKIDFILNFVSEKINVLSTENVPIYFFDIDPKLNYKYSVIEVSSFLRKDVIKAVFENTKTILVFKLWTARKSKSVILKGQRPDYIVMYAPKLPSQ